MPAQGKEYDSSLFQKEAIEIFLQSYLISMRQMTTVGKIQGHDTFMWFQKSCVHLKVRW